MYSLIIEVFWFAQLWFRIVEKIYIKAVVDASRVGRSRRGCLKLFYPGEKMT